VLTVNLKVYKSGFGPISWEVYKPSNDEEDADTPNAPYEDVPGEETNEDPEP